MRKFNKKELSVVGYEILSFVEYTYTYMYVAHRQ